MREAVAVGAEGHGRDQGHGAHGQREAPVEAPQLAAGAEAPGPKSGRRPGQQWGRRDGCPWGPWTKEPALTSPTATPRHGTSARRPQFPQLYNGACNTPEARPPPGAVVTIAVPNEQRSHCPFSFTPLWLAPIPKFTLASVPETPPPDGL